MSRSVFVNFDFCLSLAGGTFYSLCTLDKWNFKARITKLHLEEKSRPCASCATNKMPSRHNVRSANQCLKGERVLSQISGGIIFDGKGHMRQNGKGGSKLYWWSRTVIIPIISNKFTKSSENLTKISVLYTCIFHLRRGSDHKTSILKVVATPVYKVSGGPGCPIIETHGAGKTIYQGPALPPLLIIESLLIW